MFHVDQLIKDATKTPNITNLVQKITKYWENGCITQELILITFQFSNLHIHFLSHKKIIPPKQTSSFYSH